MVNTIDSKTGKLVRWESYERDKDNMTVSKWKDYYIVLSFGAKKTRSKAKEIPVRQYRVWKENGEVKCNCPSAERGEICKHQLAVWMKTKNEKQQEEAEREARVKAAIARW